jgi:lipid-binding SYLF domain-containing protein
MTAALQIASSCTNAIADQLAVLRIEEGTIMTKILTVAVAVLLFSMGAQAQQHEADRLRHAGEVLMEILNIPDSIPKTVLDKSECVIVIPSVKKLAIGIGGNYGRGAMTCRGGANFSGGWGPPAMVALEGGNIGFQLGGQATDFVLLVVNPKGIDSILKSKVKLGADAAAAAGPKGRDAQAATDVLMHAEILTYSRSRGLFAGISLDGSTLRPDNSATEKIYGRKVSARDVVIGRKVGTPAAGRLMVSALQKASPRNLSDPKSLREAGAEGKK